VLDELPSINNVVMLPQVERNYVDIRPDAEEIDGRVPAVESDLCDASHPRIVSEEQSKKCCLRNGKMPFHLKGAAIEMVIELAQWITWICQ
jgi:hypothetical protein